MKTTNLNNVTIRYYKIIEGDTFNLPESLKGKMISFIAPEANKPRLLYNNQMLMPTDKGIGYLVTTTAKRCLFNNKDKQISLYEDKIAQSRCLNDIYYGLYESLTVFALDGEIIIRTKEETNLNNRKEALANGTFSFSIDDVQLSEDSISYFKNACIFIIDGKLIVESWIEHKGSIRPIYAFADLDWRTFDTMEEGLCLLN